MFDQKKSDDFISIILPFQEFVDRLHGVFLEIHDVLDKHYNHFEIIIVDNGSTQFTQIDLEKLVTTIRYMRIIRLSRNFGEEIAIAAGLDSAIGDFILVFNVYTDPVSAIHPIIKQSKQSGNIVYGVDPHARKRFFLKFFAHLFHIYCRRFLRIDLAPFATHLRVMPRKVVNAHTLTRDRNLSLRLFTATAGYRAEPFLYRQKTEQIKIKRTLADEVNAAWAIIMANSNRPLRWLTHIALFGASLNFCYSFYIVAIFIVRSDVAKGWTTLSLQLSGMFFVVLLFLAFLTEAIGYILSASKNAPLYYVLELHQSRVMVDSDKRKNIVNASAESD